MGNDPPVVEKSGTQASLPKAEKYVVVPAPAPAPVSTRPAVIPARPGAVPTSETIENAPAVTPNPSEEVVKNFQSKKHAFNGTSLSDEAKAGLDQFAATLGIKRPTIEELSKGNQKLAAEMKDIKDYDYLVLASRAMDRFTSLTVEATKLQASGDPNAANSPVMKQFESAKKMLENDSRIDEALTAVAVLNSRVNNPRLNADFKFSRV
jgi:hypothetical protein